MPEIAADECLIKVHAIGINRADLLQRAGKYPAPAGESPILGLEVYRNLPTGKHSENVPSSVPEEPHTRAVQGQAVGLSGNDPSFV